MKKIKLQLNKNRVVELTNEQKSKLMGGEGITNACIPSAVGCCDNTSNGGIAIALSAYCPPSATGCCDNTSNGSVIIANPLPGGFIG